MLGLLGRWRISITGSGAEFAKRPGLTALMNALTPRPPFQVLVMSDGDRLGREQIETAFVLKRIAEAGVRIFYSLENREARLDSAASKFFEGARHFAADMEREKARQRTRDAMAQKAQAGYVTGGTVFGYDNIEIVGESGNRQHVERRIHGVQAAILRRIFEMIAGGTAKTFNAEAVRPAATGRRPTSARTTASEATQSVAIGFTRRWRWRTGPC